MDFGPPFYDQGPDKPLDGSVINGYRIKSSIRHTKYAIFTYAENSQNEKKCIEFLKLIESRIPDIENEIQFLHIIDHPNIIKLEECFRYNEFICLVFPYNFGHDVFSLLQENYPNGMPENLSSKIAYRMLKAIKHLHIFDICHNGIKCENFLVFDTTINNLDIRLFGFECSHKIDNGQKSNICMGTPEYCAPELYRIEPHDKSIDIWSLGISLFVMLSGQYPFPSCRVSPNEFKSRILKGDLNYQLLTQKGVSANAINLIQQMCQVDPNARISVGNAFQHPWIVAYN